MGLVSTVIFFPSHNAVALLKKSSWFGQNFYSIATFNLVAPFFFIIVPPVLFVIIGLAVDLEQYAVYDENNLLEL